MKILFYCDTVFSFGGVQRVLAEIAKTLSQAHEVTILTTDYGENLSMYDYDKSTVRFDYVSYTDAPPVQRIVCRGYGFLYRYILPHNRYTSAVYAKSFFLPVYKQKLTNKINAGNYDVAIGVHAYPSLHLASVRDRIRAKTIGWMHNSYEAFFEKENPYLPGLKDFFKHEMVLADKIIVLSRTDKKKYEECLGLSPEVIYNPLTVEVKGKADLQSKRFLSVGRFSKGHKGFDILIKAFARFAEKNKDWTLEIVGEGPEEGFCRSLIKKYHLENRVLLSPFTKNVQYHYMSACVYVLSSRWEGFGLVLIEAMAHGLPIVSSDLPVTKELLEGKGVAILFEKENVCRLAECLDYMVTEADLSDMSGKSLDYAKHFEINRIIKQWDGISTPLLR